MKIEKAIRFQERNENICAGLLRKSSKLLERNVFLYKNFKI